MHVEADAQGFASPSTFLGKLWLSICCLSGKREVFGFPWCEKVVLVFLGATMLMTTTSQPLFKFAISQLTPKAGLTGSTMYTMAGIKLALQRAIQYSPVYIFTDAIPQDYRTDTQLLPLLESTKNSVCLKVLSSGTTYDLSVLAAKFHLLIGQSRGSTFR